MLKLVCIECDIIRSEVTFAAALHPPKADGNNAHCHDPLVSSLFTPLSESFPQTTSQPAVRSRAVNNKPANPCFASCFAGANGRCRPFQSHSKKAIHTKDIGSAPPSDAKAGVFQLATSFRISHGTRPSYNMRMDWGVNE